MFFVDSDRLSLEARSTVQKIEAVATLSKKYASCDLSFDEHRPPYATHNLHSFPAKFPPPLARWAIEQFTDPGECVLDPFVGSGTTLVEARLLGRNALAAELDPLSRLLSRVKSEPLDPSLVELAKTSIDRIWSCYSRSSSKQRKQLIGNLPEFPNRDYWFHKEVQRDLTFLRNTIARIKDRAVREFFLVVYSSLIITKGSSTVANALDIAHSRAHYTERSTLPYVWTRFSDRYRRALRGLREFYAGVSQDVNTFVINCDARALPFRSRLSDATLSSSPYVTAIEYPRSHKFSVWWIGELLGVSNRIYEHLCSKYIGTGKVSPQERLALRTLPFGFRRLIVLLLHWIQSTKNGRVGCVVISKICA